MSASDDWVFPRCPECGARCGSTAARCWMCHAPLAGGKRPPGAPRRVATRPNVFVPARDRSFKPRSSDAEEISEGTSVEQLTMLLLNFALIIVGVGLWTLAPGGAFFYVLVITPAVIAIYVSLGRQFEEEFEPQGSASVRLLAVVVKSFVTLGLLITAAGIAMFISFWITCSNAIAHQYGQASSSPACRRALAEISPQEFPRIVCV